MTKLISILQKIIANHNLRRLYTLKYSILIILFFSFSDTSAQVTNNYIDYTNGTHGSVCVTPAENANATFTAPAGTVFSTVYFASYGTPTGSCNYFSTSSCNASTSQSVVEEYLLGKSGTINIPATNAVFSDPCSGTVKKLYAQAIYTQPICSGTSPGTITGSTPIVLWLVWSYQWEVSTTSASSGFSSVSGASSKDYNPGNLTQTKWYRRVIVNTLLGTKSYSPVIQIMVVSSTPPIVSSPIIYCQNGTAVPLTATGSNLNWGAKSGVAGGTGALTTFTWVSNSGSNKKTDFTTTIDNVEITSVQYTIPANQTISGIQLALYNSSGTKIATSATISSKSAGSSPIPVSNIFNYTIATAGNYSIGINAGTGTIGGDSPTFPINESTGALIVTGSEMPAGAAAPSHCFNNIQFSIDGSIAPTPLTTVAGSTDYSVTQTVNGCTSTAANISVMVNAPSSASISYSNSSFCKSTSTAQAITRTGTSGGTFSASPSGLTINSSTGSITPSSSAAGTYTVTYTMPVTGGCSSQNATTSVIINSVPSASISYANAPFCNTSSSTEIVTLTGTSGGVFSAAGLSINSANGEIVPYLNPVGLHTITYSIPASGGCSSFSTTTKVYIGSAGTWSGKINNDWNNPSNWICGIIPNSTIDATIPKQVSNFPSVITHSAEAKNLNIENGASLIISGSIKIAGTINNNGNFNLENGTLELNGGTQSIAGSMFENKTIKNLIVSSTGSGLSVSSTANDTLNITGQLSFGNLNSILNTGDNITLISNHYGTASVGKIGINNSINGKVIVEHYINTGTGAGQHGKAWQFLAVPTIGQTIKQSWMEGGDKPDNYGTMISGPGGIASGFDMYSVAPSMKLYNYLTNNWLAVSNTSDPISDARGYFVFVRGDRNITGSNQPSNSTVLRTKGDLFTGDLPPFEVYPNKFQSVGNPYASSIDFSLIGKDANVDDKFYVWDPYLYGTYGLGGYQTLSSVNNWVPVPGGTAAYPSGVSNSIIQSGQAFFVHSTVNASFLPVHPTVSFTEDCKVVNSSSVNISRVANNNSEQNRNQYLRASLFTGPGSADIMADGNSVVFNKKYADEIDGDDAEKMINSGENFCVKRSGKVLAIEAKAPLNSSDTIFYDLNHLGKRTYQLRFAPENMESTGMQAFLIDKFLNKESPVSLRDSTFINVDVTSNSSSAAADRFKIVFRQMGALPVTITSVTATSKAADNWVQWTVENESGIQHYEVEKSIDGNHFTQMAIINAKNTKSGNYELTDKNVSSCNNFYRIKIISVDGKPTYTQIIKVVNGSKRASISVYPNPIENDVIHLQLNNQPAGLYKIKLYNSEGQIMISNNIRHIGGNSKEDIRCDNLPKGVYQLEISKLNVHQEVIKIIK